MNFLRLIQQVVVARYCAIWFVRRVQAQRLIPLLQAHAFQTVGKLQEADPGSRLIVYENGILSQLAKATGASVLNGSKIVPDLDFMHQLDPQGRYESICNRYANILVSLPLQPGNVSFRLVSGDLYEMALPPNLPLLQTAGYNYVVFPRSWLNATLYGFSLVEEIEPTHLFVYKRRADLD